jgi:hypothetical protein
MTGRALRSRVPPLPTTADDWRLVGRTVRLVVAIPRYGLLALLSGFASLLAFSLSQNPDLARFALTGPLSPADRATIVAEQLPFVGTTFSAATGVVLLVVAALAGLDVAVVVYHLQRHGGEARTAGGGLVGVVLGVLGAGCAACGTVALAGLLSLFGAAGAVTLLPLDGLELALLAGVALLLSLYWLAEAMRGAEIAGCPVDVR